MPRKKKTEAPDATAENMVLAENAQDAAKTPEEKPLPASFYDLDYNELDRDLSPDQQKEWTAIYASYRSRSALTGTVIGIDNHRLSIQDPETKKSVIKEILCLVVMDFRVKVIIPHTEIWHDSGRNSFPEHVIWSMIGAKVDYVITNVDRLGECAVGSRRIALGIKRNRFMLDRRGHRVGDIVSCNIILVGPKRLVAECNGFDITLSQKDLSYTAIYDLRKEYAVGQEENAKLTKLDAEKGIISISVKETNPNPFDGADQRHPINCRRTAVITGKYAGGVFCRLSDDTNVLCHYAPGYFDEEFYIGDNVLIRISFFEYSKKQIFGRIMSKINKA